MRRLPSLLVNLMLLVLVLGAAGWSVVTLRGGTTKTADTSSTRTVTVSQGTVTKTVSADGTLDAATTATASFVTAGTVTKIYAGVGDTVKKDQLLARVDAADAKRSLALAKANLTAAEDAVTRAEDAGSDTTTADNAVTTAQLAVDDAQAAVDGTALTAPMAGTITAINGEVGSSSSGTSSSGGAGGSSSTSSGFAEIADLSALQVTASFAEADATALKAGQTATVGWSALTDATATGKVLAIDPSGTTSNGVVTYGVTVSIDTLPTGAKPGQSVTVEVTTGTVANVVSVNSAAVTLSGTTYSVTVQNDDGTTTKTTVKVGLQGDDADQITSGLTAGQKVVLPATTSTTSTSNSDQGPGGGGGFSGGGTGNGGPPN